MRHIKGYTYIFIMVVVIALFVSFFSLALSSVVAFNQAQQPLIIFLGIPVILITHVMYKNIDREVSTGIKAIYQDQFSNPKIPLIHTLYISITTLLAHLAGVSVGREGVAVQIGATIASNVNHYLYTFNKHVILCIGIATGFATFFGTPLTATLFAIEVAHLRLGIKEYYHYILILICAYIGYFISHLFKLNHLHIEVEHTPYTLKMILILSLLVIMLLLLSHLYIYLFKKAKIIFQTIKTHLLIKRLILTLILCSLIYFLDLSHMRGLGTQLIQMSTFAPSKIVLFDPLLKIFLTISFITVGFKGGEVTPIFAIGAMCGALVSQAFHIDHSLLVVCGIALFFMFTTNTRLAALFLIIEISNNQTLWVVLPILLVFITYAPKKGIYQI